MARKQKSLPFDPASFLAKAGAGRTNLKVKANKDIFAQGDPADSVFYLQSGRAMLIVTSKSGKEAVLSILGPGDFFGDRCLIGKPYRLATARTMTDCSMMQLEKAVVLRALREEPKFSDLFIRQLLERHMRVGADLADQLFNSSEKRLARTLLLLANFAKDPNPEPTIAKISQETLAEMIGTTRSRVSFFMNKFRRLGFVEYNGALRINSPQLSMFLNDGE